MARSTTTVVGGMTRTPNPISSSVAPLGSFCVVLLGFSHFAGEKVKLQPGKVSFCSLLNCKNRGASVLLHYHCEIE